MLTINMSKKFSILTLVKEKRPKRKEDIAVVVVDVCCLGGAKEICLMSCFWH